MCNEPLGTSYLSLLLTNSIPPITLLNGADTPFNRFLIQFVAPYIGLNAFLRLLKF